MAATKKRAAIHAWTTIDGAGPAARPVISTLAVDAIPEAGALVEEAGWNQTADDWRIFFRQGIVFGARSDGRLIATAALLPYGPFAWVSMVIVARPHRGHGLGTAMLQSCLAALNERGWSGVLDATPAGEAVYRSLGFEPVFPLRRWQGQGLARDGAERAHLAAVNSADALVALDAKAFGAERQALLTAFLARAGTRACTRPDGCAVIRQGRVAGQVGPIVAASEASAIALLEETLGHWSGPAFLDVPDRWSTLASWLADHGFVVQRPYLRMARGRAPGGDTARMFVIAGPEFG